MTQTAPLTIEEERALWERWRASKDRRARDRMILSVTGFAHQEARRCSGGGSYEDKVQAGMVGACKAFDKFDASRGVRFETYAMYWVRAEIWGTVGAERSQLSGTALHSRDSAQKRRDKTVTCVPLQNFDEGADERVALPHVPPQLRAEPTIVDDIADDADAAELARLIDVADLSPDERWVVVQRWLRPESRRGRRTSAVKGSRTLQELAKLRGLSRERIRQIEASAFRKIRRAAGREE